MNLDDLRTAQVDERGTDSLQPRRPTFYEDASAYLADLRERRDRLADQAEDPFSSEAVRRLNDELETAEEVVEAIYERRVGKLVKRASLAAAGMPADEAGLTEEEQALFFDLVDRIEANRAEVLDALEGEEPAMGPPAGSETEPDPAPPADTPADQPLEAAEARDAEAADDEASSDAPMASDADQQPEPDGGSTAATPDRPVNETDETDRLTVRITAAVGEIYGVDDRVYTLDAEDVVTLPEPNAKPLLERGAAQRVE